MSKYANFITKNQLKKCLDDIVSEDTKRWLRGNWAFPYVWCSCVFLNIDPRGEKYSCNILKFVQGHNVFDFNNGSKLEHHQFKFRKVYKAIWLGYITHTIILKHAFVSQWTLELKLGFQAIAQTTTLEPPWTVSNQQPSVQS